MAGRRQRDACRVVLLRPVHHRLRRASELRDDAVQPAARRRAAAACRAVVGTLLPWLLSWPLYQGHAALDFIATTGTLVNGTINLALPLLIAHAASGATCYTNTGKLRPPSESSVAPLPHWMEPWRPLLIGVMLTVVLLAVGGDLALKCVNFLA